MKLLEGLKKRVDEQKQQDFYEPLYQALRRGEMVRFPVTGVEKDEALGECLVVDLGGGVRGLVPEQEVGEHPWPRLSYFVGQDVVCHVASIDRKRGVVVLSRKSAQEKMAAETWELLKKHEEALKRATEDVRAARQKVREARTGGSKEALLAAIDAARPVEERWLNTGPVVFGVVRKVTERAAVVDIGGVLAVLPAAHVHHAPVADPREHLQPGDGINVRVIYVDSEKQRVVVSRRGVLPDPWLDISRRYKEGGIYLGKVARIRSQQDVVVELEPGIAAHVDGWVLGPGEGSKVLVLLRKIKPEARWIGARFVRVVEEAAS